MQYHIAFFKSWKTSARALLEQANQLIYRNTLITKEQMKLEVIDTSKANRCSITLKFGTKEKGDMLLGIMPLVQNLTII